ncbi:MAG: inositol monophosphatase [Pseudomonadota bacterium]
MLPTQDLITALRDAAQAEVLPRFRALSPEQVRSKGRVDDLVTEADLGAERHLIARLAQLLPDAVVVGEEGVAADPSLQDRIGTDPLCVILDPIDGTWNFAHGLSVFGMILAVVENGATVFGAIYDPLNDDWVEAARGEGAWFCRGDRRERLSVGAGGPLSKAVGFVSEYLYPPEARPAVGGLTKAMARTINLRCSAHEYRMLAQGHADLSLSAILHPWDHAAGVLILQEAGGVARLLDGRPYAPVLKEGRLLCASSEVLWQEAAATLPVDL